MMNEFFRQLANTANNFFWNVHLSFYPEKNKKIQRIQDDIFLTEKAKEIAIGAYKKRVLSQFRGIGEIK